jgi:hypothetical protein
MASMDEKSSNENKQGIPYSRVTGAAKNPMRATSPQSDLALNGTLPPPALGHTVAPISSALRFSGSITALLTPFTGPGASAIDWPALERLVAFQVENGTRALVPCGTTGESPTLTHDEHRAVVERAIALARGTGAAIIAGTGSNCTAEAIALTRHAPETLARPAPLGLA